MKKILVSVAMLAYNHEKYIENAIDSVLRQKGNFDIEIIIGEDFSTDKTREKLIKYKNNPSIKILERDKNIGVVANLLEVYRECTGEYIALLEGDDLWLDEKKILKMLEFLELNQDYIGTFSKVKFIDECGNDNMKENAKIRNYRDIESIDHILKGSVIPTCSLVFKNIWKDEFVKNYKKWLKNINYICDFQLKFLLAENGKIKYFNEETSAYRYITNGKTSYSSQAILTRYQDEIQAYQNIYINASNENKSKVLSKLRLLKFRMLIKSILLLDFKMLKEILKKIIF